MSFLSEPTVHRDTVLYKFAKHATSRFYETDTCILEIGQVVKELFVIRKGVCQVTKCVNNQPITCALLATGQVIGEVRVLGWRKNHP